ncbi:arsenate reductase (glutaredoxin) [Rhodobacteraceae bacterium 10Alg 79]|uniref:Arsenate reductase n=1 Tax=Rhodalgimonas zhirmunskyi TaxID=2964767 RepID=A0AAJ1UGJ5_9RHOB|nr:arsenate reductase (glutaredoxin) [Rhodoalgimonas zhirmunskyi]
MVIWHNPRCSKSREALKLLQERGVDPEVRLYLDNSPDVEELEAAAKALGLEPLGMMRTKEKAFAEKGLSKEMQHDLLFAAMAAEPKLIERPIVFNGDKAALGRPPEAVLDIL